MLNNVVIYDEEIASLCKYGSDFVRDLIASNYGGDIYVPHKDYSISTKKLEGLRRIGELRHYYQKNPVRFIKDFFNIQLLDSQAYLMMEAWNKSHVLIVGSRAYGKSFWIVLFIMAKQMLSCNPWNCYIASGSSQQSATTFKKLEDICNDRIDSLMNSTGKIFKSEVVINNATGDGFSHNPSGFEYKIYNSSYTRTLNSNINKNRGQRASCVCFDETSWLDADLIQVYQAFCAVDKNFKTGFDENGNPISTVELFTLPKEIPNQLIYVSSASSTDTEFYRMYREFSKKMIIGDPDYFVADIDCDLVMKPTVKGKRTKSALTQEMIDAALSTNPEKARREFYNEFSTDAGTNAIVRRGVITRNEETRVPLLYNDTKEKKFIITYDPARLKDNSVILVGELYNAAPQNMPIDLHVKLVNCVSLIDIGKKTKTPMMIPDQIDYLRKLILAYDGGTDNYDNIVGIWIDGGSGGGGGSSIPDLLIQDWDTPDGVTHRGLIDKEYSSEYSSRFPNAVNKLHIMSPSGYKSIMYEALIEMLNQDKISFTASYDNSGKLVVFDVSQEELKEEREKIEAKLKKKGVDAAAFERELNAELYNKQNLKSKVIGLDWKEELALANIDSLKEELVNIVRKKREGNHDSFDLTPDKANKMHDDRAYCCCMLGWALAQERRKLILSRKPKTDAKTLASQLTIRRGSYGGKII